MKKLLLLQILLALIANEELNAQAYIPFPTTNASWIDNERYPCSENHYWLDGDTVVNGLTYNKLFFYSINNFTTSNPCTHWSQSFITSGYRGALRNDSANKQVYFLEAGQVVDTLLYDFNYSVGDTLKATYKGIPDTTGFSGAQMLVVKIDSALIGGAYRKRYAILPADVNLRINCNFYDTLRLIEGIGSNQSLLGDYDLCDPLQGESILHCFKSIGQIIYNTPLTNNCQLITNVSEGIGNDQSIFISPNPTTGIVNIESLEDVESIEVYEMSGKLLSTSTPLSMTTILDISSHKEGIYLLKLHMKNGEVFTKKMVKE
ncbi:MAG: hypothetical protein ACI9DK_001222 [Vicingaceae bacterium]|jgi:hypothetical protein